MSALHRWCLSGFVQVLRSTSYNAKPDGSINQCLAGGSCSQNWGECQHSWQHGCSTISTSWLEIYQRWEWSELHLKSACKRFWHYTSATGKTARLKPWIMILLFPLLPSIAKFFFMSFQKPGIITECKKSGKNDVQIPSDVILWLIPSTVSKQLVSLPLGFSSREIASHHLTIFFFFFIFFLITNQGVVCLYFWFCRDLDYKKSKLGEVYLLIQLKMSPCISAPGSITNWNLNIYDLKVSVHIWKM